MALKKTDERCSAKSMRDGWQRRQERPGTIPDDLHANAHQQERRQLQDHSHARSAQHAAHLAKCMSAGLPQGSRPPTSLVDKVITLRVP